LKATVTAIPSAEKQS